MVVNDASSREAADAVAAEIVAGGGQAIAHQADVRNEAAVQAMLARADRELGPGLRRVRTGGNSWEALVPSTGVMEIVRVPVAAISPAPVGILPEDFVSVVLH